MRDRRAAAKLGITTQEYQQQERTMSDVTLEFLGLQMERLFEELAVMRTELAVIQTEAVNLRADLSALTDLTLKNARKNAREMVLVKEMLSRIDARMHRPN
jgi:hypothetical protein